MIFVSRLIRAWMKYHVIFSLTVLFVRRSVFSKSRCVKVLQSEAVKKNWSLISRHEFSIFDVKELFTSALQMFAKTHRGSFVPLLK